MNRLLVYLRRNPLPKVPWRNRDVILVLILCTVLPIVSFFAIMLVSKWFILTQPIYTVLKTDDTLSQIVLQILTLSFEVGVLFWVVKRKGAALKDLGFRKFSWWRAIISIVTGIIVLSVLVSIVYGLVLWLVPGFNSNQAQEVGFEYGKVGIGLWISAFFTIIIAPIVEETYFRGFILPALSQRFGIIFASLVSSGLFAVLHFQPNVIIYTFILGLLLCYFYSRYKSIWVGIILHSINNAIAFAVIAGLL